jgi:dephospho-CoA kinase
LGFPVADTDLIAREVVEPGEPAWVEIRENFGEAVFRPDGALERSRLAELVFGDAQARERLEAILHPRIRREWERRVAEWRSVGHSAGAVIIPLLYETGAEKLFEAVICVACTAATQRARLRQRGWSEEHLAQRLAAQLSLEEKVQRADFIIWTEPPMAVHEEQLRCIMRGLGVLLP